MEPYVEAGFATLLIILTGYGFEGCHIINKSSLKYILTFIRISAFHYMFNVSFVTISSSYMLEFLDYENYLKCLKTQLPGNRKKILFRK